MTITIIIIFLSDTSFVNNITKDWPELYSMTADPQENFNVASLLEYEEVFEDNDDGDDDGGVRGEQWSFLGSDGIQWFFPARTIGINGFSMVLLPFDHHN